ncbi:NADPH:quinone reductase [Agarivorans aestuarii]|uniref:NADPH:quinone reductase n=1 Tax=Agarivorans aestuarii TaxID=1563703 RepID=A0ABU7GB49_9ALTE|nr:NADPH:quinone reductase [Agarivorans aestuarii]MEE1675685.1 NADPH:quinone reductase [Agarivorans aestuarii]
MQAIQAQHHGDTLSLEQIDDLQANQDQILIKVEAAGVNPVDTYIVAGTNNYTATFPHTPGKDAAGTIVQLGAKVSGFKLGQRVYCAGTLSGASAELCLASPQQVHPLPDCLSYEQGACLGTPYATAWRALFIRARSQSAETVLIHGASGGVGLAAIQLAKAAGCRVFATAGSEAGLALLKQQGADVVANHHQAEHYQTLQQAGKVDVILEMLANQNLGDDLPLLNKGGRVVVIGSRGSVEINPRDLMARDACVMGMALANADSQQLTQIHAAIYAGATAGFIRPVISQSFNLADTTLAHEAVMQAGATGNIVVKVTD